MRTAENQRIGTAFFDRRKISLGSQTGNRIIRIDKTVFDQRHKQRTRLTCDAEIGILGKQCLLVGTRCNGGRRCNDADVAVLCCARGGFHGGIDDTDDRDIVVFPKHIKRVCRYGTAGDDNRLAVRMGQKKADILRGITADCLAGARAVGNTTRVTEIDQILCGQK